MEEEEDDTPVGGGISLGATNSQEKVSPGLTLQDEEEDDEEDDEEGQRRAEANSYLGPATAS